MGFVSRAFEAEQRAINYDPAVWQSIAQSTHAGVDVTEQNALTYSAIYACVRVLAESVASLPLHVYERLRDGGKKKAQNFYLYPLLHDLPNPEMTSFELRETLMGHLVLWGRGYAEIEYNRAGRVISLWPLRPDMMRVVRRSGELVYVYRMPSGEEIPLASNRVMHLRGLSFNGVEGYSPIRLAAEAIALGMATESFGSRLFQNDARPGGVLQHPGTLSDDAYERLRKNWEARHQGLSKAHRTAILEEGMNYQQIGIPPEDAQFLETRKFQKSEIASIFRVPPHMIADLERATFSNIEHQSLEFVQHTLRPWLVRWEQAITRDLILPNQRGRYYAEHLIDGLLRGDIVSRYQAYATGRQNGFLSANDIRQMENMNPIEDGGDVYLVPLNMVPATAVGEMGAAAGDNSARRIEGGEDSHEGYPNGEARRVSAGGQYEQRDVITPEQRAAAGDRQRLANNYRPVILDAAVRVVRREANDILPAAKKYLLRNDVSGFFNWLADFYEEHTGFIERNMRPVLMSYAVQVGDLIRREQDAEEQPDIDDFLDEYLASYAQRHAGEHRVRVERVVEQNGEAALPALESELAQWPETKANEIALDESTRLNNAVAITLYGLFGVQRKTWVAFGDNCPYCSRLNGTTASIAEWFLPAGLDFEVGGAVLKVTRNVGHPPAHRGCDCMVVAG